MARQRSGTAQRDGADRAARLQSGDCSRRSSTGTAGEWRPGADGCCAGDRGVRASGNPGPRPAHRAAPVGPADERRRLLGSRAEAVPGARSHARRVGGACRSRTAGNARKLSRAGPSVQPAAERLQALPRLLVSAELQSARGTVPDRRDLRTLASFGIEVRDRLLVGPWSLVLSTWSVRGPWSLVRGPSLVGGPLRTEAQSTDHAQAPRTRDQA